ncbi:LIM-domain binding protein-domain-containing protein [Infundibulicybe gibba]|nr:LIM-domain binding protein-domain-containing protein [Infundibulicybe gibba]
MLGLPPQFNPAVQSPGQPQISNPHLGLPPNSNGPSPPMNMLPNGPNSVIANQQRYQIQIQQAGTQQQQQQRHNMLMRQQQGGQPMNPGVPSMPGSHMPSALGPNQLPNMGFPGNMMQQPGGNVAVRRVPSQPQLNPGTGHLGGMPPNMNSNMNMGMNPQNNMPAHLRQVQGVQHQQLRQPQGHMQGHEMAMGMGRPLGGNGMPPNVTRSGSAQIMNSLSQPPSHSQNPATMSNSMHPNFQNTAPQHPQPQMSSSPRPGSMNQSHPSSMQMGTPGSSHTPVNRTRMTPDNSMPFMNFGDSHNPGRMQTNNGQFPLVPSSSSPIHMADMPSSMPTGIGTPNGTPHRQEFHQTPAQMAAQHYGDGYGNHIGNMPPPNIPPRPPSHPNHHPPLPQPQPPSQQPHHQSSHQIEHMNHPQRPQSQPQTPSGRPPSQSGHTPRAAQLQLPPNGSLTSTGRIPHPPIGPPQPGLLPQPPGPGPHLPIAPRPPQQPPLAPGPPGPVPPPTQSSASPPPGPRPTMIAPTLGNGQGVIRLLQFSALISSDNKAKLQLSWWNDVVKDHFTPAAVMKFTLWKDNQRNEAKPFEIGVPILPRFFLVTTQSGVKSMTLSLDGARERIYAPGHVVVECVTAIWTYKYNNGYTVTLRGPLTTHLIMTSQYPPGENPPGTPPKFVLKFEDFQFDATHHDKYIAVDSIIGARVSESPQTPRARIVQPQTPNGTTSQQQREEDKKWDEPRIIIDRATIPGEPVNAFGIPQATMRCLELAESVAQMADLITFARQLSLGPLDALTMFANRLRENQPPNPGAPSNTMINGVIDHSSPHSFPQFSTSNGVGSTPAVTLYSPAPASVINPPSNPPPPSSMNSPQNAPPSGNNSPQKQHKTIPQQQQQQSQGSSSSSAPNSSPAVDSGASNTPSLANSSLKRKQTSDTASPTTAEQPAPKRTTRKGRRATGGG